MRGSPFAVLDNVNYTNSNGDAFFDFSQIGTLIYERPEETAQASEAVAEWLDGGERSRDGAAPNGSLPGDRSPPPARSLQERSRHPIRTISWIKYVYVQANAECGRPDCSAREAVRGRAGGLHIEDGGSLSRLGHGAAVPLRARHSDFAFAPRIS